MISGDMVSFAPCAESDEGDDCVSNSAVLRVLPIPLATVLLVAGENTVFACSICRCGDPTFNALGADAYSAGGFRAALDWERFDKEQGAPGEERESLVENRFTALLSYGFSEGFTLVARVPFSHRDFSLGAPGQARDSLKTNGLSDPEIYALVRLWSSSFAPGLGRRASLTAMAGLKMPWGRNHVDENGERVDEHAQAGTGSTDGFAGLSGLYLFDKRSSLFSSVQYRRAGENDFGYRYGRIFLGNLAYEHKLGDRLDGVVELNYRHAGRDRLNAQRETDPSTGGSVLYITPRLLLNAGGGIVLRLVAQIPVVRDLNRVQEERTVINAGVTFLLGSR